MHRVLGQLGITASVAALTAVAGCAMPRHQDAVFFGTDTKVAFDVGVQPENGNTPSLTLGYKRREFVYMPLAEYGPAPQLGVIEAVVAGDLIRGETAADTPGTSLGADTEKNPVGKRHKYQGKAENDKKDSYSVFATFGGNFDGSTDGAGAKIKQVFATGIAAQIAAEKGADYVNPQAPDANQRAAAAQGVLAGQRMADATLTEESTLFNEIKGCATPESNSAKWKSLVANTKSNDPNAALSDVSYQGLDSATDLDSAESWFSSLSLGQQRLFADQAKNHCPKIS